MRYLILSSLPLHSSTAMERYTIFATIANIVAVAGDVYFLCSKLCRTFYPPAAEHPFGVTGNGIKRKRHTTY